MQGLSSIIIVGVGILLCGCASQPLHSSLDDSAVSYSSPSPYSLERLDIRRISIDASVAAQIAALPRENSPWGSRWVVCKPADMMHAGPWTTRLYISDTADPHRCIFVGARDLGNGGVDYEWLSEKLLFVRCWWGRIVSTDIVLDTDTARPIYIEDADYGKLVYAR
jgi:hypothetical protein